jgi:UDPglucose 6-dehydrogenase
LLANYNGVSQNMISAIVEANSTRKEFLVNAIIKRQPKAVGIYRLVMKAGSDNFRESAIADILEMLRDRGLDVIIYEPSLNTSVFNGVKVVKNFNAFVNASDLIITNRLEPALKDFSQKVFTRDIFGSDL